MSDKTKDWYIFRQMINEEKYGKKIEYFFASSGPDRDLDVNDYFPVAIQLPLPQLRYDITNGVAFPGNMISDGNLPDYGFYVREVAINSPSTAATATPTIVVGVTTAITPTPSKTPTPISSIEEKDEVQPQQSSNKCYLLILMVLLMLVIVFATKMYLKKKK